MKYSRALASWAATLAIATPILATVIEPILNTDGTPKLVPRRALTRQQETSLELFLKDADDAGLAGSTPKARETFREKTRIVYEMHDAALAAADEEDLALFYEFTGSKPGVPIGVSPTFSNKTRSSNGTKTNHRPEHGKRQPPMEPDDGSDNPVLDDLLVYPPNRMFPPNPDDPRLIRDMNPYDIRNPLAILKWYGTMAAVGINNAFDSTGHIFGTPFNRYQFTRKNLDPPYDCNDIHLFYARGTGERGNIGWKDHRMVGVSPGYVLVKGLERKKYKVSVEGVDYPAHLLDNLPSERSVCKNALRMVDLIYRSAMICPRSMIIVSGYSQGSAVVHQALKGLPTDIQDKVIAAVTFGDTLAEQQFHKIDGFPEHKGRVICNRWDGCCMNSLVTTPPFHFRYGKRVPEAITFIEKRIREERLARGYLGEPEWIKEKERLELERTRLGGGNAREGASREGRRSVAFNSSSLPPVSDFGN